MTTSSRVARHRFEARHWSSLSDEAFVALVTSAGLPSSRSGAVEGAAETAHVKLVPLSEHELAAPGSTANLFDLPAVYHHRFASLGFGAWRELALHRRATEWVLDGSCARVVLLRHARVLPVTVTPPPPESAPWVGNAAITAREAAARGATSSLALVFERFPATLLRTVSDPDTPFADAARFERQLLAALDHCRARGVLHLDPHLENVMTDGSDVFLTDFGLGTSAEFERTPAEDEFADTHRALDASVAVTGLVHAVVRRAAPIGPWREALELEAARPTATGTYLRERLPIVEGLGRFYRDLRHDLTTPFPDRMLAATIAALSEV